MSRVAVLGAGSWGTALAQHLARKGEDVRLWARRPELASEIQRSRENAAYLRGFKLPETLRVTSELPQALEALGAIVDDIAVYKTLAETDDRAGNGTNLLKGGADWITFTSASTVEHFHARFDLPSLLKKFPQAKLASIGPETSKPINALGLKPTVEARDHSIEGLVAALLKAKR